MRHYVQPIKTPDRRGRFQTCPYVRTTSALRCLLRNASFPLIVRKSIAVVALSSLIVAAAGIAMSQTGFTFEPEMRARLIRMVQKNPDQCVALIEQAESLDALRQTLIEQVRTQYSAAKIIEAARALRETDLSGEMTLRELQETAKTLETEKDDK